MNATNRGANRVFIALFGIVLIALGIAAVAVGANSNLRTGAESAVSATDQTVGEWMAATPLPGGASSWLLIGLVVVAVIVILALAAFVFRQGRGHTSTLMSRPDDAGSITIDTKVASQAIQDALSARPELIASHVSSYAVRGTPMLKVTATARRGVSPRDVTHMVDQALVALDAVLGVEIPALVHISGGFRARTASATRLG